MDLYCTFEKPEPLEARDGLEPQGASVPWWVLALGSLGAVAFGAWSFTLQSPPAWAPEGLRSVPLETLQITGVLFALPGAFMFLGALGLRREQIAREALRRAFPGRPGLDDHRWTPDGIVARRWAPAFALVLGALAISGSAGFMVYHWWRGTLDGVVKVVVVIFAAYAVVAWFNALHRVLHAIKYEGARLQFRRFPYRVGEPVELVWWPPTAVRQIAEGSLVLRCIRVVVHGSGRSRYVEHTAVWQGSWSWERPRELTPGSPVSVRYELPSGLPATGPHDGHTILWELEVMVDTPGLDYHERFLVPVY